MSYEIPKDIDIVLYVFKKRKMPENPSPSPAGCMKFLIHSLREAIDIAEIHPIPNRDYLAHLTEFLLYVRTSSSQYNSTLKICFEHQLKLLEIHKIL